jgi:hypothetical protein
LICIPPFVSEILVRVGTTILSEATRDASCAPPSVWKRPDLWTHRTRPQVFAKPQTVSHSSHTPSRHISSEEDGKPEPRRIIDHGPTDSAEEADVEVVWLRFYLDQVMQGDEEFRAQHKDVLAPVMASMTSPRSEIDKATDDIVAALAIHAMCSRLPTRRAVPDSTRGRAHSSPRRSPCPRR